MRRAFRSSFLSAADRRFTRLRRRRRARHRARYARRQASKSIALPDGFARNLILFVGIGVAFSAWLLHYTDWFESFAGLLALGGVASWLAFVSRILSSKRLDQLQTWTDDTVLANPRTAWWLAAAIPVGLAAASCFGTVQLNPHPGSGVRTYVQNDGPSEIMEGVTRMLVLTPFFAPAQVRIKVSGLSSAVVDISAFQRYELDVPRSFIRPIVVLRPNPTLEKAIEARVKERDEKAIKATPTARFIVDGTHSAPFPYQGEAIVLGTDGDVDLPGVRPLAYGATFEDRVLRQGMTVGLAIFDEDGKPWGNGTIGVSAASTQSYVQILEIAPAIPSESPVL